MRTFARRLWAFVLGDIATAESLGGYPNPTKPGWLGRAAADQALAKYAVEAATRGFESAENSLVRVQDKAHSFLTFAMSLVPFAFAGTALSVPQAGASYSRIAAFLLFILADLALIAAAALAALASGLALSGGMNLDRIERQQGAGIDALQAEEADAWYFATMTAFESTNRKARDLFDARRAALVAVVLAGLALIALLASVGGQPGLLLSPVASPTAPLR